MAQKDQSQLPFGLPPNPLLDIPLENIGGWQPQIDFTQIESVARRIRTGDITGSAAAAKSKDTTSATNQAQTPADCSFIDAMLGRCKSQAAKDLAGIGGSVETYFMRGIVIILGFIFVAVGLSMFKIPAAQTIVRTVKQTVT